MNNIPVLGPRVVIGSGLLLGLLVVGCSAPPTNSETSSAPNDDVIYQVATLNSLLAREYEGTHTVGTLLGQGSLGLGTVDRLDGEMVIVDGTAYAIRNDGTTDELDAGTGVPFGVVTPFEVDTTITLTDVDSFPAFQSRLDEKVPTTRLYSFRVTGEFDSLETRSVTAQQPPYPSLKSIIANQTQFTFEGIEGTMVGFRLPDVFEGVNAVGHHAHFVTASRNGGGHVLGLRARELTVEIDRSSTLQVDPRE